MGVKTSDVRRGIDDNTFVRKLMIPLSNELRIAVSSQSSDCCFPPIKFVDEFIARNWIPKDLNVILAIVDANKESEVTNYLLTI